MEQASKAKGVTTLFDPGDLRKWRHKWQNTKEFETVKTVRNRVAEMVQARRSSCYWASADDGTNPTSGSMTSQTGSDWDSHWDMNYKQWSMWHDYIEGRSNLKSPMSFAPIEAAMAEFQGTAYGINLIETDEKDKDAVMIWNCAIEDWESKNNMDQMKAMSLHETMICGSSWTYNCYLHKEREVEYILSGDEVEKYIKEAREKSKKSKTDDHDQIKKKLDEEKKPLTKKGVKVDYDDFIAIPVSIREIYPDPAARCVRGPSHEMTDLAWRTVVSVDQFYAEFRNCKDPFVLQSNIEKVKPAMEAAEDYGNGGRFFDLPNDLLMSKDQIELVRYYNKLTDKYIIYANDVLVRDGPLPYNHKEIPFALHKYMEWPHQLYGIGMPTMLESLQSEDEAFRNMAIELLKRQLASVVLVNSDVAEDFMSGWDSLDQNLVIEMSGSVGNDSVRILEGPQSRAYDVQQMRNGLREDSIMTSGVNPLQYSVPKAGEPVRNNLMSQESTLKIIRKGFANWGQGYREVIRQGVSIMAQCYPDSYTENKDDAERKTAKSYRKIKIKGHKILQDPNSNKLVKERLPEGKGESRFELRPEFISLSGPVEVRFNIEAYLPPSKASERQDIQAACNFLIPILSNPQLMSVQGITELIKEYCEIYNINERVTELFNDSSSEDDVMLAEEQNNEMMAGKSVAGEPGVSDAHKITHAMVAFDLRSELSVPNISPQEFEQKSRILDLLIQHMTTDNIPLRDMSVAAQQMPMPAPPQPPMPQGGMGGPMDPMMAMMMQGGGMPPGGMMGQPMPGPQGMPPQVGPAAAAMMGGQPPMM